MNRTALAVLWILALGSGPVGAEGDAAAGKTKAATCAACHGADGNSINPEWPSLAGQHATYLLGQISAFQGGELRKNALMAPMVASLSDQDKEDIAAFFSAQPRRGLFADQNAKEQIAEGEKIYRAGNSDSGVPACMGCHGPDGAGNELAKFPAVANQHAQYTATQLRAYRSGERKCDSQEIMCGVTRFLTDNEIDAVAQYLTGLH